ncbi:MAG: hypothetical protein K6G81_05270 [Lachnospiraceae bacterium]|nr:hypothetical protein [Lachnospiraceae bacterium]
MEDERSVLVGIDLANDYSQICYYSAGGSYVSVSLSKDPLKYRIPTMLCAVAGSSDWLFGEEAALTSPGETVVRIDNIVELASNDSSMEIFGRNYPADILLERYFRRMLASVRQKAGAERIRGVVLTMKECNDALRKNLYAAFTLLGLPADRIRIIRHTESFMYYVVEQNCDIWINDVGLFDFDLDGFVFYKLSFGRKTRPLTVLVERTDLSDEISFDMLSSGEMDRLIYAFENVAAMMLQKQMISALYFTGCGFESAWADESLKKFCSGRRIFRGQNLYVKGAGYAAKLAFDGGREEYRFIDSEELSSDIMLRVYKDGGYDEIKLAGCGEPYEGAYSKVEVIMDKTNELDFIVHNALKKDFICAIMTLDTLSVRQDRTTRLEIELKFPKRDVCVITVRDLGFGEIRSSGYQIWEQVLKI